MNKGLIKKYRTQLDSGELSVLDLYNQYKKNIDEKNTEINALIEVYDVADQIALAQEKINKGEASLLTGIPCVIKDNILIKGKIFSAGSKTLENYVASYDSKISEILKSHAAIVVGRANMDEFAMGSSTETSHYGNTLNPLDLGRVPGGSSGGSAASVAADMAVFSFGSDTGGSIRQPASFCGLVGLKGSYGSVSRNGLMAMASSLDVIGPIAKSVEDAALVQSCISEYDELDSTSVLPKRRSELEHTENKKVIGVPKSFLSMEGVSPDVLENFTNSIEKMKELGYSVKEIDLTLAEKALATYYILQPAEASSNLARYDGIRYGYSANKNDLHENYFASKSESFGKEVKRRIMLGTHVLSSGYHDEYYNKAIKIRQAIKKELDDVFAGVDVIATPTAPDVAFKFGEKSDPVAMYMQDIFTVPYNLSGHPAVSVPSGLNKEGMPYGIHFSSAMFSEKKMLSIAQDFESTQK